MHKNARLENRILASQILLYKVDKVPTVLRSVSQCSNDLFETGTTGLNKLPKHNDCKIGFTLLHAGT